MGSLGRRFNKKALIFAMTAFILACLILPVQALDIYFTEEELDYLANKKTLKAASIDGGAPLHYRDSQGEIRGIAVSVLDEIAKETGLEFEYALYDSIDEVLNSGADLAFGVSNEYAPPTMALSQPYLTAGTIVFYHAALEPKELKDKRFAAIKGGTLPPGIKEENTIYFSDREATMDAVETGQADYGYGNEYSVAFYLLQNNYKNIIAIPASKGQRAYCIGVPRENQVLLSIINKGLDTIDQNRLQTLILDVASQIERKITFPMIVDAYWQEIFGVITLVIGVLVLSIFVIIRAKKNFEIENKRYEILSRISNESLFEYKIRSGSLTMSERFNQLIDRYENKDEVIELLKNAFKDFAKQSLAENISTIRLPFADGTTGVFKIFALNLREKDGKIHSVIGKLMDISEEIKEKEELLTKSQSDGLTGLYNATTTKKLICESMESQATNQKDALIIIDGDKFKAINDNYGHLKGNWVLENIAKALKQTFRQTDIIGRIGGDEFCVYLHDIPSVDFVHGKCQKLMERIEDLNQGLDIAISMGVGIFGGTGSYEELFQQADQALYIAKRKGGNQTVIYGEERWEL